MWVNALGGPMGSGPSLGPENKLCLTTWAPARLSGAGSDEGQGCRYRRGLCWGPCPIWAPGQGWKENTSLSLGSRHQTLLLCGFEL